MTDESWSITPLGSAVLAATKARSVYELADIIDGMVKSEREACAQIAREQACVGVEAAIRARGEK